MDQSVLSLGRLLLLSHSHLLLSGHGGVRLLLLLLQKSPGLVSLLLQVIDVRNELDRVDNTVVVEEHTGDLSSGVTILLLDHTVDGVTNLLASLSWVHLREALSIYLGESLLAKLLLLHGSKLLRGISCLLHVAHTWLALRLHVFAVTATLSHVVSTGTTTVVEVFTTLATTLATLVATATLITTLALLLATVLHVLAVVLAGHVVEVLHEVLLDLVEATLLTLLMQLLGGHPELN